MFWSYSPFPQLHLSLYPHPTLCFFVFVFVFNLPSLVSAGYAFLGVASHLPGATYLNKTNSPSPSSYELLLKMVIAMEH